MLNYRRHIAFLSRVHTYVTVLYAVIFFLFLFSMHLESNEILFGMLVRLSYAVSWLEILLGSYLLISSIYISIAGKVLALEPLLLTLLRLVLFSVLALVLEFIVHLTESGLSLGVNI